MAVVTKSIGSTGDYSTIAGWEAATNLNSGADIWKGECQAQAFDEAIIINVDGTSTTSYVWLTTPTANAHAGIWSTSKARIAYSGGNTAAVQIESNYCRVDWQQISRTGGGVGTSDEGIRITSASTDVLIEYNVIWSDQTVADIDGIYLPNQAITAAISNNVVYGFTRGGLHCQMYSGSANQTVDLDHNVLVGNGLGADEGDLNVVQTDGATVINAYNNIWSDTQSGTTAFDIYTEDGGTGTITFNGSDNAYRRTSLDTNVTDNMTASVTLTDDTVDSAPSTAGHYVTDYTGITTFDFTPVDHANNAVLEAGVNRQGSEADSRQDFSVAINGARGTTNVDIGAFQISGGAANIDAPAIAAGSALFAPTVAAGAVNIAAPFIAAGSALFAPTVASASSTQNIDAPAIAAGSALFAPTVAAGAANIDAPTIAAGSALFAPTVAAGAVNVDAPAIASGSSLFAPTVAAGAAAIAVDFIAAGSTLFAPQVAGAGAIGADFIPSGSSLFAPVVAVGAGGAQNIDAPFVAAGSALFAPTVAAGAVAITVDFIAAGSTLFAPTVIGAGGIAADFIPSGNTLFAPALTTGAVNIDAPFIAATSQVFAVIVAIGVVRAILVSIESTDSVWPVDTVTDSTWPIDTVTGNGY